MKIDLRQERRQRLTQSGQEARQNPRIARATGCWWARRLAEVGVHDGIIRADHPVVIRALEQPQSATSLRRLLRDPQGFGWRYALGWRETVVADQAFDLDPRAFGDLVHRLLQRTVNFLERGPGFGRASADEIEAALCTACDAVLVEWPLEWLAPPPLLWRYTLDQAGRWRCAPCSWIRALRQAPAAGPKCGSGTPTDPGRTRGLRGIRARWFGCPARRSRSAALLIGSSSTPAIGELASPTTRRERFPRRLKPCGGAELQRVLYAVAVAHHRPETRIQTRLVFLAEETPQPYPLGGKGLVQALAADVQHLNAGVTLIRAGTSLPGPHNPWEDWNELRIALPAIGEPFTRIKDAAFRRAFGDFAAVWRAQ